MIHEIFGLSDWLKLQADELAAQGYIVVAPDLVSGLGAAGGGTDALGLRRLRRSLQLLADADPETPGTPDGQSNPDMLAHALLDPRDLAVVPDRVRATTPPRSSPSRACRMRCERRSGPSASG